MATTSCNRPTPPHFSSGRGTWGGLPGLSPSPRDTGAEGPGSLPAWWLPRLLLGSGWDVITPEIEGGASSSDSPVPPSYSVRLPGQYQISPEEGVTGQRRGELRRQRPPIAPGLFMTASRVEIVQGLKQSNASPPLSPTNGIAQCSHSTSGREEREGQLFNESAAEVWWAELVGRIDGWGGLWGGLMGAVL
ncbi:hypothetical protein DR999_PMT02047 [Platysternon megacephalum]|uniref:Uncharacterized protein n=1 Tax=Platysternon megacephalum TaxID=55544 RepID=A0A4D9FA94_9SAUR|nr:hypothetical protein DR999_PMT02047 [Platysternon megacephalum]